MNGLSSLSLGSAGASINCRAPDISYISKQRLAQASFSPRARRFFPGAPDLAIEILSPNNTRAEINERLKDFFSSGTQIAWIINPDARNLSRWQGRGDPGEVLSHSVQWHPKGMPSPFALDLAEFFAGAVSS